VSPTRGTEHAPDARRRADGDLGRDRALLKEFYGRGPTRAKSYYEDDLVVCLLRGGFSRVEQTLLEGGRGCE
jgi:hypothetical protein